jgi:hypothetical protein
VINIGTRIEILPRFSDGQEVDTYGHCTGWVRDICADGDLLIELQGTGEEVYVSARRVRV